MRIIFSLLVIFGLCSCGTLTGRDTRAAELHLELGTSQMMQGNYPEALVTLLEAERLDPKNPTTQNNLGLLYFMRQRYELSEKHIRQALQIKPEYSDARNNLARVLIERGRFPEAIQEAQVVTQDLTYTSPEKAYVNLSMAYFRAAQYEQAKRASLKAIEYQRDNCLAHNYYGRSFFEEKNYKRASEALDRAVGFCMRTQYDEPHYYSALAYFQLGQQKRSEARFEELIKIYPEGQYVEKSKEMLELIRR